MSTYDDRPMTTASWFLTLLVLSIPLVNIICFIVWACGAGNRNRVTYCRASLLWLLIGVLIYGVLIALGVTAGLATGF